MNKEYYTEYYELERNHWWFRVREGIIQDSIYQYSPKKTGLKILNIGAATGRSTEMLSQFGHVTSLEYDKDCCDFTSKKTGIPILNGSILNIPFEEQTFDLVCAFDVIEHVADDATAVAEMHRVCKNNGSIFITVPAFMHLWSHHDVINHHFRRYTMTDLVSLFKKYPGRIQHKTYFNSLLFFPISGFRLLSRMISTKSIRNGAGSDFSVVSKGSILNNVFYHVFNLERRILKYMSFNVGVSVLFVWQKNCKNFFHVTR